MSAPQLLRWQWEGYARYHCSHFNLLLHMVLVPLFLMSNGALVVAFVLRSWPVGIVAVVLMTVSIALQGRGHRREPHPPEPFTGPRNAFSRILLEQWVTFPRFVLSGGWSRALRDRSAP